MGILHLSGGDGDRWGNGLALRYGGFYGPGTWIAWLRTRHGGAVRKRQFPIVGDSSGVFSRIHIDDAAATTVAAVEHGGSGYLQTSSTTSPRRCRMATGAGERAAPRHEGVSHAGWGGSRPARWTLMMTDTHSAWNAKAKRGLGWKPRYASSRLGFARGLG